MKTVRIAIPTTGRISKPIIWLQTPYVVLVWKEVKPLIEDYYSALAEGDTEKASKDIDTEKGVFTFNGHKFNGPGS